MEVYVENNEGCFILFFLFNKMINKNWEIVYFFYILINRYREEYLD